MATHTQCMKTETLQTEERLIEIILDYITASYDFRQYFQTMDCVSFNEQHNHLVNFLNIY